LVRAKNQQNVPDWFSGIFVVIQLLSEALKNFLVQPLAVVGVGNSNQCICTLLKVFAK
jgi:hypothetical protein